jgi:hypothetical protein
VGAVVNEVDTELAPGVHVDFSKMSLFLEGNGSHSEIMEMIQRAEVILALGAGRWPIWKMCVSSTLT